MANTMRRFPILLLVSAWVSTWAFMTAFVTTQAAESPYLKVGKAKTRRIIIAYPSPPTTGATRDAATVVQRTIKNDLLFVDTFRFLGDSNFPEVARSGAPSVDTIRLSAWDAAGAEILLKTAVEGDASTTVFEMSLYDTKRGKQLASKRYTAAKADLTVLGHTVANDIAETLTGLPGIFLTQIAMSCDTTGKKEIYLMDFDGTNQRKLTDHRSIALGPAWSLDAKRLAYSVFTRHPGNIKNIDLFIYDFKSKTVELISNRKGMNSGASFHPKENRLALTMSFLGNPEIFSINLGTKEATRLTTSYGVDVDPVWAPDGQSMAFVSSRSGPPMVYSMDNAGQSVKRLTFAGKYNATPSWSPQNNKIAFAGMIDGHFDIFIMNPDGTNIERLTKDQGGNEDPHFSPDGNFLVFSSNRTGKKNIYVMNIDGTFVKRLTYGLGNCVGPKWSPVLKSSP